jgi:hypothetical protein
MAPTRKMRQNEGILATPLAVTAPGLVSPGQITLPITGRRRLIVTCQFARLRRSGASDCSLRDLRDRVTRGLGFCEPRTQEFCEIVFVFGKYLSSNVVQFLKYRISHR